MKEYSFTTKLGLTCLVSLISVFGFSQCPATEAVTLLKEGNERFCSNQMIHQNQSLETVKDLTNGQHPFAVIISCSDSRVTPEIIFDQGLGDLFSIRTAGNVMADFEVGSIEYAVDHLDTRLVVVLGHTHCGAIKAFMDVKQADTHADHDAHAHGDMGHIQSIINKLDSEEEEQAVFKEAGDIYNRAVKANVAHGVKQLKECDPILSNLYKDHKVEIVGALYDIESGKVEFLEI